MIYSLHNNNSGYQQYGKKQTAMNVRNEKKQANHSDGKVSWRRVRVRQNDKRQ